MIDILIYAKCNGYSRFCVQGIKRIKRVKSSNFSVFLAGDVPVSWISTISRLLLSLTQKMIFIRVDIMMFEPR